MQEPLATSMSINFTFCLFSFSDRVNPCRRQLKTEYKEVKKLRDCSVLAGMTDGI